MNNQKPIYRPFSVDLVQLCNGNMDQQFLVEVWDWDANGRHDFIGSVMTTIREFQVMKELQLRNPKRLSLVSNVAGFLNVIRCEPGGAIAGQPLAGATQLTPQVHMQGATAYPRTY